MALKAILLGKKLKEKRAALEKLIEKDSDFEKREAEIAAAIEEVNEESTAEERSAVDELVNQFDAEKAAHEAEKAELDKVIGEMEADLAAEEAAQNTDPAPATQEERKERKETKKMESRAKFFGMNVQERDQFFAREDVKNYLQEVRSCIREKRALTNVGLTIPTVMLELLRENLENYSKLYRHVRVTRVNGTARQLIMGAIPEAIWTDCCANLNELTLGFNDLEMDCYRVGGYFAVCNANLEDSDIALASELLTALGQANGLALDKAILFGRNTDAAAKMPLGVVSRLAQTSQPAGYPATARAWADLHTSNIKTIANTNTGIALFQALMLNFGAAKGKYSRGEIVHVMNETTYTFLMAQAMSIDAAGAVVSGVRGGTMPVIGGIIEVLNFVPDYVIVSGYFDLYVLAERAGQQFAQSEHVRFLQDQTVFKGTARYDGAPAIAEAFVVMGVNGTSPDATAVTFAPDEANEVQSIALNTATAAVTAAAGTSHTVQLFAITAPGSGTVSWTSSSTGKATVDDNGVVTGVASGNATITATCNGKTATCAVTVS